MKYLFVISLLMAFGCATPEQKASYEKNYLDNLKYYRDARTDICYSGFHFGSNAPVLTYVPCTDKVRATALEFVSQEPVIK